jgi:Fe-Mn family superoxide dismutase
MPITLAPLPYPPEALEPHIDAATMKLHHGRHHKAYVDGFNAAEEQLVSARNQKDFAHILQLERVLSFNGGGHLCHALFWQVMAPTGRGGGDEPAGPLAGRITQDFGDFQRFQSQFNAAALSVEGSGWAWLTWHPVLERLHIQTVFNHENNLIPGSQLLMGVDVWEHAYYLKYRNDRAAFVRAWWNVCNWQEIERRYAKLNQIEVRQAPIATGPELEIYPEIP